MLLDYFSFHFIPSYCSIFFLLLLLHQLFGCGKREDFFQNLGNSNCIFLFQATPLEKRKLYWMNFPTFLTVKQLTEEESSFHLIFLLFEFVRLEREGNLFVKSVTRILLFSWCRDWVKVKKNKTSHQLHIHRHPLDRKQKKWLQKCCQCWWTTNRSESDCQRKNIKKNVYSFCPTEKGRSLDLTSHCISYLVDANHTTFLKDNRASFFRHYYFNQPPASFTFNLSIT